jgi:hypothetical protein
MANDYECFSCEGKIDYQYGLCQSCYRDHVEKSLAEATGTSNADIATRVQPLLANPTPTASHVMRLAAEHEGFDQRVLEIAAETLAYDWVQRSWLAGQVEELKQKVAELEAGAVKLQEAVGRDALKQQAEEED